MNMSISRERYALIDEAASQLSQNNRVKRSIKKIVDRKSYYTLSFITCLILLVLGSMYFFIQKNYISSNRTKYLRNESGSKLLWTDEMKKKAEQEEEPLDKTARSSAAMHVNDAMAPDSYWEKLHGGGGM